MFVKARCRLCDHPLIARTVHVAREHLSAHWQYAVTTADQDTDPHVVALSDGRMPPDLIMIGSRTLR